MNTPHPMSPFSSNMRLNMKIRKLVATAVFSLLGASTLAHASSDSAVSILGGESSDATLVGVSWKPGALSFLQYSITENTSVTGEVEFSLSQFDGDKTGGRDGLILGATPLFSFQAKSLPNLSFQVGIGANYFTEKRVHQDKTMGTHYQFGDLVGVQWAFGPQSRYSVGYRFIHYSNAGISSLNPGLDFHLFRFTGAF